MLSSAFLKTTFLPENLIPGHAHVGMGCELFPFLANFRAQPVYSEEHTGFPGDRSIIQAWGRAVTECGAQMEHMKQKPGGRGNSEVPTTQKQHKSFPPLLGFTGLH
jgi:hypothetical protein